MKKIIVLFFLVTTFAVASAQQGYNYFYAGYSNAVNYNESSVTLGLDFPNKYNNSWDVGLTGYLKKDYESLFASVRYKPVIYKGIDTTFKNRLGVVGGTDFSNAIFAPEVGFELSHSIAFGVDIYLISDFGYYINSPVDRWRVNIGTGLKFRW